MSIIFIVLRFYFRVLFVDLNSVLHNFSITSCVSTFYVYLYFWLWSGLHVSKIISVASTCYVICIFPYLYIFRHKNSASKLKTLFFTVNWTFSVFHYGPPQVVCGAYEVFQSFASDSLWVSLRLFPFSYLPPAIFLAVVGWCPWLMFVP